MNLLDPGKPLSVEGGIEEHQLSTRGRESCFVSAMHQDNFFVHILFTTTGWRPAARSPSHVE
ncbi:hypothetical protein ERT44_08830 [Stenotrophomonas sp. MA5]|nr:hypothetical protein ERT44_08830 [Stenotrophomonas sp. MA5]